MTEMHRRAALRRILNAATVPLMAGVARSLVAEAEAQTARRLVVVCVGEALLPGGVNGFTPPGIAPGTALSFTSVNQTGITLPSLFTPLEKYRARLALVDGLYSHLGETTSVDDWKGYEHGACFSALTGLRTLVAPPNVAKARPAGPSIDQAIAQRIGRGTRVSSLLFGFSGPSILDSNANTFAAGRDQPLAHLGRPSRLLGQLTGALGGATPATGGSESLRDRALVRKRLLDVVRQDATDLRRLVGQGERERLDGYLSAIDRFDKQQDALVTPTAAPAPARCDSPRADDGSPVARLTSMFQMATLALRCGLTNVVGVSVGNGYEHHDLDLFVGNLFPSSGYGPHGGGREYHESMAKLYQFLSQQVVNLLDGLGPLAQETVVAFVAGTPMSRDHDHHGKGPLRFPMALIDGTGKARTGGRYVRYAPGDRSVNDFFNTLGHLTGAPMDNFGSGGTNKSAGPLPELLG
jgi:hypothetical protein